MGVATVQVLLLFSVSLIPAAGLSLTAVPPFPSYDATKYRIAVAFSGVTTTPYSATYNEFRNTYNATEAYLNSIVTTGRTIELLPVYFIIQNLPSEYNGWTALEVRPHVIDAVLVLANTAVCVQKKYAGARIMAGQVGADGSENEAPVLLANKDKKWSKLEDVKGRRIGFNDPTVM